MTVQKIYCHSGENVMVYCLKKNPIFFEIERTLYPTVYLLWKFPDLLESFTTFPPVISKLQGGADLMLPGVVIKDPVTPTTFKHLDKGVPCSVNTIENRAPVAVGKTALSGSDMYNCAMRGKGVIILHTYKDQLWALGDKSHPPDLGIPFEMNEEDSGSEANNCGENDPSACDTTAEGNDSHAEKDLTAVGDEPCTSEGVNGDVCDEVKELESLHIDGEDSEAGAHGDDAVPDNKALSPTDQMDLLLYHCLLHALKVSVKKTDYPLLTSKLFRAHMVPCCPPGQTLDVKKSSHKKLSKFLQEMEKKDLLMIRELTKGVESVTAINRAHPDLKAFVAPDPPDEMESIDDAEDQPYVPPELVEMYGVSAAVLPLFSLAGYSKGSPLRMGDVRKVLTDYVKENELSDPSSKGHVVLDALLSDVLLKRGESVTSVKWDDLFKRCYEKMNPMHQITFPGEKPVVKKGKVESVTMMIAQRGGNKKVTLIENLEQFGIDPHKFAHEVQVGIACSTSVTPLPGKLKGMQVLIQGNQINYITDLLLGKYQLNKKYLEGVEKGKKPGKKR